MLLPVIIRTFIASTFDINIRRYDSLQFLTNRWQHTVCKHAKRVRLRHRYQITKILIIAIHNNHYTSNSNLDDIKYDNDK